MTNNLKDKAIRGVFWSAFELFSTQGTRFILGLILARLLEPKDYGLVGMISIFIAISQTFVNSGFSSALIQKKDRSETDFSTVFWFNLAVSIFFYILFVILAPVIARFYDEPSLALLTKVITLNIIINAFIFVQRTKLTIELNFKTLAKINLVSVVGSGFVGIFLAYKGYGVWALVLQTISRNLFNTILVWISSKWIPIWKFSFESFRNLFSFGSKLLGSGLLNTIFDNIYKLIIGKLFNAESLGYYTKAQQFQQLPSQSISTILAKVTFPVFSQIQDDNEKLIKAYRKMLRLSAYIMFPLMIGILAISEPMIKIILTEKWLPTVPLLKILCVAGTLYPIHSLNLNILKVKGRSDLILKLTIIKKILIIVVILAMFPFGINALVFGQIITSIVAFFINTHYTKQIINYGAIDQMKDFIPTIFITAIMFCSVIAIKFIFISDLLKLIIGSIVGASVYYFCSKVGNFDEKDELKSILKKVLIRTS